jgi:tetratricopeptide (TPR) repeat protein
MTRPTPPPASAPETPALPLWMPLVVLATAVVVRLLYAAQVQGLILFDNATGDAAQYVELAARLRAEGPLAPRGEAWFQAPLYAVYLALLGPGGLDLARWFQFAGGGLGALLAFDTARRLGGPPAGLVAGLLAALYAPRLFFEGELLSIAWALLFLQAFLWCLVVARGARGHVAAGLFAGLATLAQPNALLAGVAAAAGFGWLAVRGAAADRPAARRSLVAFLVGLLLPILPVTIRNRVESGDWILVSANGGINFFIGNHSGADGTFHLPADEPLLNDPDGLVVSARETARRALGREIGPAEASDWWLRRGLGWWAEAPLEALALTARKVLITWNAAELPNHYDFGWFRERVPILRILPGFLLVAPLAVWGLLRFARSSGGLWLWLPAAGYMMSVVLFFVTDRYRLPLLAWLLPAAGLGAAHAWRTFRGGRPGPVAVAALTLLAAVVLAAVPLVDTTPARAHMHNLVGTLHYQRQEIAAARREFDAAAALSPASAEPANNLGRLALIDGNLAEAERWFETAVSLDPRRPEAWFNLEELERNRRRFREALGRLDALLVNVPGAEQLHGPALRYRRGLSTQALGDTATARALFREAVERKPDLAGAWGALGLLDARAGRFAEARRSLERAAALVPGAFGYQYNLGLVTEQTGDYPAALAAYRRAIDIGGPSAEISRARERVGALTSTTRTP